MKSIPQIQKFMTTQPHSIGYDISIKEAMNMMREHQIRHLPVENGGRLVGILTDRDIKLAASFKDAENLISEEIMTPEPYTVSPNTPIDEVAKRMAEHKYGCAIVQQENGKVVGIFTITDALRVLLEMTQENYKH